MQVASSVAIASDPGIVHGLTVETITEERVFQSLQSEWDDVVARAQIGHPFLCHGAVYRACSPMPTSRRR